MAGARLGDDAAHPHSRLRRRLREQLPGAARLVDDHAGRLRTGDDVLVQVRAHGAHLLRGDLDLALQLPCHGVAAVVVSQDCALVFVDEQEPADLELGVELALLEHEATEDDSASHLHLDLVGRTLESTRDLLQRVCGLTVHLDYPVVWSQHTRARTRPVHFERHNVDALHISRRRERARRRLVVRCEHQTVLRRVRRVAAGQPAFALSQGTQREGCAVWCLWRDASGRQACCCRLSTREPFISRNFAALLSASAGSSCRT